MLNYFDVKEGRQKVNQIIKMARNNWACFNLCIEIKMIKNSFETMFYNEDLDICKTHLCRDKLC